MLDNALISDCLDAALSTGGDFAELFTEETKRSAIGIVNGITEKASAGTDSGAGIRVISGSACFYAYSNDITKNALIKLALNCAAAVNKDNRGSFLYKNGFADTAIKNNIGAVLFPPDISFNPEIASSLKEAHHTAKGYHRDITQTNFSYSDCISNIQIANSDGLLTTDSRTRTRVSLTVVAGFGEQKQTSSTGFGSCAGLEFFKSLNINNIVLELSSSAVTMLNAAYAPGGVMPVVINSGRGGVIFHEACGHSLEATALSKNASVFCGRLGTQIANEALTAIDDGTLPNKYGSLSIDDEGEQSRRNVLIENGILKSYLTDKRGGAALGLPPTGSARRESYRFAPTSRMTNTYIAPNPKPLSKDEIISSVDYGLYAADIGGGSVNPATGEFNFAVHEGYIIKNGKISHPVRGAILIGKGEDTLRGIDMVASELAFADCVCGSQSGGVPVCVGQPAIRVNGLTIGGRA